jgi:RNA polymerase sigma factor (sigma-70 family)
MAKHQAGSILRHLRRLAGGHGAAQSPDRELLERFVSQRDETAFTALVERHGPLVMRVCRRVLADWQAAEDAFQATFLVLARKANSIARRELLSNWLHGVAYRVASRARVETAKRAHRQSQAEARKPEDPLSEVTARELCAVLDEEMTRLPQLYRLPLLLCHLEGQTRDQAASQLGTSVRTVTRRLERGRELLRVRLTRRGITLPAALLVAELTAPTTSAAVPSLLAASTVKAAMLYAVGSTAGASSPEALTLAEGVLKAMSVSKLKIAVTFVVLFTIAGVGAYGLQERLHREESPPSAPDSKERIRTDKPPRVDVLGDPLPAGATARLGTKRFRHQHTVRSVVVSRDGTRLVSASWDGTLRVWDAGSGKELHRFPLPGGASAAISPDGALVAGGGMDKAFHVWDLSTGQELFQASGLENSIMAISFGPDSKTVATISSPIVRIWDIAARKELRRFVGPDKGVYSMALSADGKLLAGGCDDHSIRLWEAASGNELRRLEGHADFIYSLAFAPDGKTLASAGADRDRTIRIWNTTTGEQLRRIDGGMGWVRPIAFSPDGKQIACGGQESKALLYNRVTGKELRHFQLPGRDDTWVMAVSFSPNGKRLVTSGSEKLIRQWDVDTGKELQPYPGHQAEIAQVAISADGRKILTAGHEGQICLWERTAARLIWQTRQAGSVTHMVWAADGKTAVTADGDTLRVWDVATRKEARKIAGPKAYLRALAISPDGSLVVAACWDRTIRFWTIADGLERSRITVPSRNRDYRGDCPIAFTPDGKTLISGSADNTQDVIYVWDVATGKELRQIKRHALRMAVSPDGRTLATTDSDGVLHLWDVATGKESRRIDNARCACLAFSPDGRCLATGDGAGVIHLWEFATGRERRRLSGHESGQTDAASFTAGVSSLAFARDGRTLISGGGDTTVLVWDILAPSGESRSLDALWTDLGKDEATVAYDALCGLVASPHEAAQFLSTHLVPAKPAEPERVRRWIADLDSERFDVRETATRELEQAGEVVVPALRKTLEAKPSNEVTRRVTHLLERLDGPTPVGKVIQAIRSIEILERIGSAEARTLLRRLASDMPETRLTREAKAALNRR